MVASMAHAGGAAALRATDPRRRRHLDIGGESTRPGAPPVSLEEELARVMPVLREAIKLGVPVSVDTYKPRVMQAVLDLGADIINDIWALRWQEGGRGARLHGPRSWRRTPAVVSA